MKRFFTSLAISTHLVLSWPAKAESTKLRAFDFDHDAAVAAETEKLQSQSLAEQLALLESDIASVRDAASFLIYQRLKENEDYIPILKAIQQAHRDSGPESRWRLEEIVAHAPRERMSAEEFDTLIAEWIPIAPSGRALTEIASLVTRALSRLTPEEREEIAANQKYIEWVGGGKKTYERVALPADPDGELHRLAQSQSIYYSSQVNDYARGLEHPEQIKLLQAVFGKVRRADRYLKAVGFDRIMAGRYTIDHPRAGPIWALESSLDGLFCLHSYSGQFNQPIPIDLVFAPRPVMTEAGITGFLLPNGETIKDFRFNLFVTPIPCWDWESLEMKMTYQVQATGGKDWSRSRKWKVGAGHVDGFWSGMQGEAD